MLFRSTVIQVPVMIIAALALAMLIDSYIVKHITALRLSYTNVDIFTAKNAEMTSVGVLWGFRTRNELVQAGADYIAENPHVILQLIGR